jgi:hypothetical protein
VRVRAGWQEVAGLSEERASHGPRPGRASADADADGGEDSDDADPSQQLPRLQPGQPLQAAYEVKAKQTQPPPRYTEATLLAAMAGAGKQLDDEALQEAMKERGLGTPATRAAIIETLLDRGYITRAGKQLQPTPLGLDLIARLPVPSLGSAQLTGEWEARLSRMARGEGTRAEFMADIARYVQEIITAVKNAPPPAAVALAAPARGSSGRGGASRSATERRGAASRAATPTAATDGQATAPRRKARTSSKRFPPSESPPAGQGQGEAGPRKRRKTRVASALEYSSEDAAAAPLSPGPKRQRARAATTRKMGQEADAGTAARAPRRKTAASATRTKATRPQAAPASAARPAPPPPDDFYNPSRRPSAPPWPAPPPDAAAPAAPQRPPASPALPAAGPALPSPPPVAIGRPVEPPLPCPRCRVGSLIWGRRAWGCSNFRACPLVIPYDFRGRRLGERDLRNLIERGESLPMLLHDDSREVRARLRLSLSGEPDGFVAMVPA